MLRRERCPTLAFPADGAADFRGKFPDDADLQHDSHSFNNRAAGARSDFSAFSRATDPNDSQIPDPPGRALRGGDGPRSWIVEKSTGRSLKTTPAGA
jgi:hypothetical protein